MDLEGLGNLKFSRDAIKKLGVKPWLGGVEHMNAHLARTSCSICESFVFFYLLLCSHL